MSGSKPDEKRFESYIETFLNSIGFKSRENSEYDSTLSLIGGDVIEFVRETQPDSWRELVGRHGVKAENTLLRTVHSEISKSGTVKVLRSGVSYGLGANINLCFFEPKSGLSSKHQELYHKNRFTLIRQLKYSVESKSSIDMVLFLNGLPLITIELKNQLTGQNIKHSEEQYEINRDPREPLFKFKRCIAYFCVDNDKASMATRLAGKSTHFLPYNKGIDNPAVEGGFRTDYLWSEIFEPDSLLDIIENFVHLSERVDDVFNERTKKIESRKPTTLIFPRYHQLELIRKFKSQLKTDGPGNKYLVQHATGSGKSFSIGWLAHTLTSFYRNYDDTQRMFDTIVIVTDRKVLDKQLRNTVKALEQTSGVVSGVEKGSKELKEFLESGKDIVITTIQKFPYISETITSLRQRNFAVIIDEVHSSQSGELSKELKKTLSKNGGDKLQYEDYLIEEIKHRGKQDHISFFGFTGTPKEKTLVLFGTIEGDRRVPFHVYSMSQSIHEEFTLDVLKNYTIYKRYLKLNRLSEYDDQIVPLTTAAQQILDYVDSHEVTIEKKVGIMLDHWANKGSRGIENQAKGMIVTRSRKHCVQYFYEVNKQLKERRLDYHALVAFSGEIKKNGNGHTEDSLNREVGHIGDIPRGLKSPRFRLLIIAEKFQTGFSEPLVQTMYVDKAMSGVQCVQTLSRLNRAMRGKTATFVLDFVNEPETVEEAFQQYYKSTILTGEIEPSAMFNARNEIECFNLYSSDEVDKFCEIFFDPKRNEGALHSVLNIVVDRFQAIEEDELREKFRAETKKFVYLYEYLSQIITFKDQISLEKSFLILKYLIKKLPTKDIEKFDVADVIDLNSLRIQKIHEFKAKLDQTDFSLDPSKFGGARAVEPELDLLSSIIEKVNQIHGFQFTDDDKITLSQINEQIAENEDIFVFMRGDSSNLNKQEFFKEQFDKILLGYVKHRLDFYKRMTDNPIVKALVCAELFNDYQTRFGSLNEARI